jgi:hypothetical protein
MQKIVFYFLISILLLQPFSIAAQNSASSAVYFKQEKSKFIEYLKQVSGDTAIVYPLSHLFQLKIDSIQSFIMADGAMTTTEKEKASRSLVYFIKGLSKNISLEKFELYDIPGALESYKKILKALLYHQPFTKELTSLEPRRSQLLAATFMQYREYALLDDIAVYKRIASSPELIFRFLESKPDFRFTDSLLLIAAVHDPMKFIRYLKQGKPVLQEAINNTENIYLRQIVSLSGDKNASELLPFVIQLAENRITPDTILTNRKDVIKYFQLLVNTVKESKESNDASFIFQKVLRKGLKDKSLSFYVNDINEHHNAADAIRFASVKGLRPEDIYYIITSAGEELYTSSYLGLYKRLMENFKTQNADSIFTIVQYDNFRTFMRLAANYNVFADFLSKMPQEKAAALVKRFISGIENETNSGLEKAMDIADSFTGLNPDIIELVQNELESNLNRCVSDHQYFGIRLYNILMQVFELVKQKNSLNKLWNTLGNYEVLNRKELENKNKEIVELALFYGDNDGIASFNSFQKLFTDTSKWQISRNASWVTIHSVSDEPVIIYANLPLDNKDEMDLKAQDSLFAFLDQHSLEPTVLIHRGHSYHLGNTLKRLRPSVKLAILGSCGSYNNAISIASINPDAQIIGSKKTGSKSINDPIIDVINETLLSKNDLSWPEIWDKLSMRFSKDEFTLNLFNEYIPPGKNVSLFVLKLFNYYNRSTGSSSIAME